MSNTLLNRFTRVTKWRWTTSIFVTTVFACRNWSTLLKKTHAICKEEKKRKGTHHCCSSFCVLVTHNLLSHIYVYTHAYYVYTYQRIYIKREQPTQTDNNNRSVVVFSHETIYMYETRVHEFNSLYRIVLMRRWRFSIESLLFYNLQH